MKDHNLQEATLSADYLIRIWLEGNGYKGHVTGNYAHFKERFLFKQLSFLATVTVIQLKLKFYLPNNKNFMKLSASRGARIKFDLGFLVLFHLLTFM